MDQLAYQLAEVSAWVLPLLWCGLGVWALVFEQRAAGVCLLLAGLISLLWNFLFLPALQFPGHTASFWPVVVAVEDASLGFYLSNVLPIIFNASIIAALFLFVSRRANMSVNRARYGKAAWPPRASYLYVGHFLESTINAPKNNHNKELSNVAQLDPYVRE